MPNGHFDLFDAIRVEILEHFNKISSEIYLSKDDRIALTKLARSDRKKFAPSKVMSRFKSRQSINFLLENGYLMLERSREQKPMPKRKNEKLPKELRRYIVHDKVQFKSNYMRFWFRFIEPNLALLRQGDITSVLDIIKADFDNYASLAFENLSISMVKKWLNMPNLEIYSYWTKEFEIDIYAQTKQGEFILGEVKYKERKMCKNTLNALKKKAEKMGIDPKFILLISKSGFSQELFTLKGEKLKLFDLESFKTFFE
ncbi:MAG: DUF234 domain-containing protein [Campylobacter sp.]|nr:DUF234 domain-containing protein [Campylobacter sp.]